MSSGRSDLSPAGRNRPPAEVPHQVRATRISSGGVRERPNRTVSKTVVPHGYRGFKSHLLRSGPRGPPHRRMRQEQRQGDRPAGSSWSSPGGRKGVNDGTRTFDIRKTAARPGQEGTGQGQDGRPPLTPRGQGGGQRANRRTPRRRKTSTRRSCSSSSPLSTRTWPKAASRWTTSRSARRSCGPSSSCESAGPSEQDAPELGFAARLGRQAVRRALRASAGTLPRWSAPRS